MIIIAACLAPLCFFGSPADFWFVAVGALVSTVVGCILVLTQEGLDVSSDDSCYYIANDTWGGHWKVHRPAPTSPLEFGKGNLHQKMRHEMKDFYSIQLYHVCICWSLNISNNSS